MLFWVSVLLEKHRAAHWASVVRVGKHVLQIYSVLLLTVVVVVKRVAMVFVVTLVKYTAMELAAIQVERVTTVCAVILV